MQFKASTLNGILCLHFQKLSIDLSNTDAIDYNRIEREIKTFKNGIALGTYPDISPDEWKLVSAEVKKNKAFHVCQWACFTSACIIKTETTHAGHKEVSVNFSTEKYSVE